MRERKREERSEGVRERKREERSEGVRSEGEGEEEGVREVRERKIQVGS